MAGTTATFTGCIDTDEPEGITNLRGAKSELIKAQAAVKLVEVEWQKAQVAYQELENKAKELSNQYQEYDNQMHALDVELKKLEVERAEAATEREKAEADAKIAEANRNKAFWENKMAEEAEIFRASLLTYQKQTAVAQEAYDNAMALIEAGKLLLSDGEKAIIDKAQQRLFVASAGLQQYYSALKTAQDEYDAAIMAKKTRTLPQLQAALKIAELTVERQEKVVKESERLLALADEFSSINWDTEVKALDKKIQDAEVEKGKAEEEKSKIINKAEYHEAANVLDLKQKALGASTDGITAKTAWGAYNKASKDSLTQVGSNLTIKEYTSEPINAALQELFKSPTVLPTGTNLTYTNGIFSYGLGTYTQTAYNLDNKNISEAEDPSTVSLTSYAFQTEADINAWLEYIKDFGVNGESVAQQQAALQGKKKDAEDADKYYKTGLDEWQVLVDAVSSNGAKLQTVPTDKDEKNKPSIKTAVKTYNDAITALGTAITAYNKAYDDSYKKAYDKSIADAKEAKYIEQLVSNIADAAAWQEFNTKNPNATNAEKITMLESIVLGKNVTAAKKTAEDYVKTDPVIATAKNAGALAWNGSKEETSNKTAIQKAETTATNAFNAITTALSNYVTLAQGSFGQNLKETIVLDDISGKGAFLTDDTETVGHKKTLKTTISDDNFAKLVAVKYDERIAKASLLALSKDVFGSTLGVYNGVGRLTPVTEPEVREHATKNNKNINSTNYGLLGAKIQTADDVKLCQDLIAAKDKLDELTVMLNGVLANLEAEIKANTAKMDPFIADAAKMLTAVEKAQADVEAAEDVKNAYTTEIDAKIIEQESLVGDLKEIKKTFVAQINSITGGTAAAPITAEQYADTWKNNVALAEQALANYQEAVDVAEESITLYNAGKYTLAYNVEKADLKMKKAEEAYNIALEIYNKALADVKAVLETLTK